MKLDVAGLLSLSRSRTTVKATAQTIAAATPPSNSLPKSLKLVASS